MKIPSEARGKCLKQIVEYTHCAHKAGPTRIMFSQYPFPHPAPAKTKSSASTDATKKGKTHPTQRQLLQHQLSGDHDARQPLGFQGKGSEPHLRGLLQHPDPPQHKSLILINKHLMTGSD